jgi:nucleotide-binding universal stress UspA family protein
MGERMSGAAAGSEVVVGVDGSAASYAAVSWASHEAAMRGLPIKLCHVVAPTLMGSTESPNDTITQAQEAEARRVLEQARRIVDERTGEARLKVRVEIRYAAVVGTLVDASRDAHMIVVDAHGLDEFGWHMLGSVSSGLLHHAHCPVTIIHDADSAAGESRSRAPILVGIDGSPACEAATALAFDEAARRRVPLVALHACSDVGLFPIMGMDWRVYRDEGYETLGERLAGWQGIYPDVQVHQRLVWDVRARWLVGESGRAQLVVLGSRGRGGFDGLRLGSVSSAVAQSADVPVIVVRSAD